MSDREVLHAIETSRLMRTLTGGLSRVRQIAATSVVVNRVRDLGHWWNGQPLVDRRRALGIMLVTAGGVHILLVADQPTPGSMWMVIPLWTMCVGVLLVSASVSTRSERESGSDHHL
jgi:hypothetical protein